VKPWSAALPDCVRHRSKPCSHPTSPRARLRLRACVCARSRQSFACAGARVCHSQRGLPLPRRRRRARAVRSAQGSRARLQRCAAHRRLQRRGSGERRTQRRTARQSGRVTRCRVRRAVQRCTVCNGGPSGEGDGGSGVAAANGTRASAARHLAACVHADKRRPVRERLHEARRVEPAANAARLGCWPDEGYSEYSPAG
jgi:hypothetical protein